MLSDWHQPPRARKLRRRVRLTGELARGELKVDVFALYEPPGRQPSPTTPTVVQRAAPKSSSSTIRRCPPSW
ncbi:hypothetical protein I552_1137 [Mycobacterium xenopi 3993]|nr:hypothetical protein I552_1137 [Mycobacterium xenopi 3993]